MTKDYNKVPVKNNMKVERDDNNEEVAVKERPKMTKMVTAQPKKVKRNLFSRLVAGIVGPDGLPGIGAYVNDEIIKPAIKNIIVDAVTSGINQLMYRGEVPPHRRTGGGGHTQYNRMHTQRPNHTSRHTSNLPEPSERRVARPSRYGVTEYMIPDRQDASNILFSLSEHADKYDVVSVADYYDMIGVPSVFTDNDYGWTFDSISRAVVVSVRGGYIINFPPVEVI